MAYIKTNWADNVTNLDDDALNKIENELGSLDTQLADISINPINYIGTDFQKLQSAINDAISQKKSIMLGKMYDITGQGTLMLSENLATRTVLNFTSNNSGGVKKTDAGFMFSAILADVGDFRFQGIKFEGTYTTLINVFDCDKLIRISTEKCFFIYINSGFYTTNAKYIQSITMNNDLILGGTGYFIDCNGGFNINLNNILQEESSGGFFNHRGYTGSGSGIFTYLAGVSIVGCGLEGFLDNTKPVIVLKDCRGVAIQNNHFEANVGGDIYLDPTGGFSKLSIKNNFFVNQLIHPIRWGGELVYCLSENNINLGNKGMHDTTNVTLGNIVSISDYWDIRYPNTDVNKKIKILNYNDITAFDGVMKYTQQVATDGYTSDYAGITRRITCTVSTGLAFTIGETKSVPFVFPETIKSDDTVSIWVYDKTGLKMTLNHWYLSVDKLTLYYVITNNEATAVTMSKLRVTVLKTMGSVQG